MNIKTLFFVLLLGVCPIPSIHAQPPMDSTPPISLFESVERVRQFLQEGSRQDCSGQYLRGVQLQYIDGHPRQGLAWVYSFSYKKPRLGGENSIFHYMDGEIIEFRCGP
jgi:hypothetical protein